MTEETRQAAPAALGDLDPRNAAVFLDFDGVLVDIAPHPDAVVVAPELPTLLRTLEARTGGAVAIVTGRELADLRRHLPDVPGAVIGAHGAERQVDGLTPTGEAATDPERLAAVHERAARATAHPGVMVERKPTGAAIHFRNAPEHEEAIRVLATAIAAEFPGFEVLSAKCAFEIRPEGVGKDKAVAEAMEVAPFAGRVPVYVGDDVTDEPALAWVAAQGGIAVHVGPGESAAPHRLDNPAEVHAALSVWLDHAGDTA